MTIQVRLNKLLETIRKTERRYGRTINSVQLIAVSKTKPASMIATAYQAGQRHFGENYVQEAYTKQKALSAFNITWHFIGPIQSNKTKLIANQFDWVHSVDSLKIAERLNAQRPVHLPPLNICLQINISEENSKSGFALSALPSMVSAVLALPHLNLRGVMAIPEPQSDLAKQRIPYQTLVSTTQALQCKQLTTFSFGMTDDLEAGIAEGATFVRIGSAIFGARH